MNIRVLFIFFIFISIKCLIEQLDINFYIIFDLNIFYLNILCISLIGKFQNDKLQNIFWRETLNKCITFSNKRIIVYHEKS